MKHPDDPRRLADFPEDSPSLAGAIAELRREGPTDEQLHGVAMALRAAIAAAPSVGSASAGSHVGASATSHGSAAAARGAKSVAWKLWAAKWGSTLAVPMGLGAITGAVTVQVVRSSVHPDRVDADAHQTALQPARPAAPVGTQQNVPSPPTLLLASPSSALPQQRPPVATQSRPSSKRVETTPMVEDPASGTLDNVGGAPAAPETDFSLISEAQEAQARGDAARALALADEHEARFGAGAWAQEREVIAVGALMRLGRRSDARERAVRFHALYPGSAHGRRIDMLLESTRP
jgi:hypothetical protein